MINSPVEDSLTIATTPKLFPIVSLILESIIDCDIFQHLTTIIFFIFEHVTQHFFFIIHKVYSQLLSSSQ